jgi:hypothetical protein
MKAIYSILLLNKKGSAIRFDELSLQEDVVAKIGGDELHQRINALKERRKNDRINLILYAAARGDLAGLKDALKV